MKISCFKPFALGAAAAFSLASSPLSFAATGTWLTTSGTARFNGTNNVQIWNGGIVTLNGGTLEQNGKDETARGIVLNGGSITGLGTLTSGSVMTFSGVGA